jgi:hypothetical protein
MGEYFVLIQTTISSLDEEGVDTLLHIAEKSSSDFDCVAKAAIHHERLGVPANSGLLSKLIMGLEELEERKPHLGATDSILKRLIGPLGGVMGKRHLGIRMNGEQIRQHEQRSVVVKRLFYEVGKKRPLKAIAYLMETIGDPRFEDAVKGPFELIMGLGPWKISYGSLDYLKGKIVPALRSDEARQSVVRIIDKIIDEARISLIYLVGPLLAATKDPSCGGECKRLLDKLLQKRIGTGNKKTMTTFYGVLTANLCNAEGGEYGLKVAEKMVDEGQVPLIYLVGPALTAMKKKEMRRKIKPLLIKIKEALEEGRKLGNVGEDLNLRTERIVKSAILYSDNSVLPLFIMGQMKREGLWSNDYEGPTWKRPIRETARIKNGKTRIRSK